MTGRPATGSVKPARWATSAASSCGRAAISRPPAICGGPWPLFRETGDRAGEATALASLGDAELRQGRYQQAAGNLRQALALFREIGDRAGEAEALNGLGEVLLATGQPGQARTRHAAALGLASQIGDQYQQARAHDGLGCAHQAADDPGQARRHWQQALTLYTGLGSPEAEDVRAQLRTVSTTM